MIFRYINPLILLSEQTQYNYDTPLIDLAVFGQCGILRNSKNGNKNGIDMNRFGNVKSILLNIDNSTGVNCSDKDAQIITCGLKEKDTAIFSSINLDEGNVILDLQRSIKNINGETVDLFEKQIDIPDFALTVKTEDLILALTALTFCGMI